MYARMDITGDGVVDSQCKLPTEVNLPKNSDVVPGNLGLYSGACPLPELNGNLYNISSDYVPMNNLEQNSIYFNRLGLVAMPDYKVQKTAIGTQGYFYPMDGRVIDNVRGIRTILDRPAQVGNVDMDLVGSFDNSNYGANYRTYSDIQNGQFAYYVDTSHAQPFDAPVYTLSSYVDKTIRKDPMDSIKPEYIKTPITTTLYQVSNDQQTRDTLLFREDIMSRQQNLNNRQSWTARWIEPLDPSTRVTYRSKPDTKCGIYAKNK